MSKFLTTTVLFLIACRLAAAAPVEPAGLDTAWRALDAAIPRNAAAFKSASLPAIVSAFQAFELQAAQQLVLAQRALEQSAPPAAEQASPPAGPLSPRQRRMQRVEQQLARRGRGGPNIPGSRAAAAAELSRPQVYIPPVEPLLIAKERVDAVLDQMFAIRGDFAKIEPAADARLAIRNYLRTMSVLIDLSARLRHTQFDIISFAAAAAAESPANRERIVQVLTQHRSSIGAAVMADLLFDPEGDPREVAALRASDGLKARVLNLIGSSSQVDLLPELASFVLETSAPPALIIQAAEVIKTVGLPQDPRPGQDPTLPPVAITAKELRDHLATLKKESLNPALRARHAALLAWLDERIAKGVTDGHCTLGAGDIAPGDWLLMRNPSPYNLFTDLSPGMFTHVGVVASEKGPDGITRIVLVDLPERGTNIPATTVDTFVKRTRHYVVLRHEDPKVAQQMGEAAASLIGNESQFDLTFRTDRVNALAGKPLKDEKVHTYCAGLLLLCALQTGHPREEFFPVAEFPANDRTLKNLESFGMSIGKDFISPTGALFSPKFKIVARREPMYEAGREIEEAVYDYFAQQLAVKPIDVSADAFQMLRLKIAEASKTNELLAQALASVANVNVNLDMVSAAKAAAVVEILDEAARTASADYVTAQQAIKAGVINRDSNSELKPADIARIDKLREQHAELYRRWTTRQVSPRDLRVELINFYVVQGKRWLDERFFRKGSNSSPN
jgi:hypothetical protein